MQHFDWQEVPKDIYHNIRDKINDAKKIKGKQVVDFSDFISEIDLIDLDLEDVEVEKLKKKLSKHYVN
jgi:hypothetical protein